MSGLLLAHRAAPLGMLLRLPWPGPRRRMPALLWLAPLPGPRRGAAGGERPAAGARPAALQLHRWRSTRRAALLLGGAALLWSAAGAYARPICAAPAPERFAACWLLTLTGSLGVFMAGDLGSFYLAFALVSLAAYRPGRA